MPAEPAKPPLEPNPAANAGAPRAAAPAGAPPPPPDIRFLFEPRGVAVIGASSNKGKLGYKIVENIVLGGAKCRVYPINPQGGEMLGLPIYASVNEAPGEVDVACQSNAMVDPMAKPRTAIVGGAPGSSFTPRV